MSAEPSIATWRRATAGDIELIARWNAQLSEDEGSSVADHPAYVDRLRTWLTEDRYRAAVAEQDGRAIAYVVWREDRDDADVFVRQFFVARDQRGRGLGRALFEDAVARFWPSRPLRLDVYDSNPRGGAFWESLGFTAYSRLLRRPPLAD